MDIKCRDIAAFLEELYPTGLAESYDNVGLLVGDYGKSVKKIIITLEITTGLVKDAVAQEADLIVSHHPLIFKPLKRIIQGDTKGRLIRELIKNDISVYALHTNLDIAEDGLNEYLSEVLQLHNRKVFKNLGHEKLYKVVVFIPAESVEAVRTAMAEAGAGFIGDYSDCFFMLNGTGMFKPLEGTNPYIGALGNLEKVEEVRLETIVPQKRLKNVITKMLAAHPYEEPAYDIYPLEVKGSDYGLGRVGELESPKTLAQFADQVKERLNVSTLRIAGDLDKIIRKAAVFSGAFDDDLNALKASGADVLVTGDLKYHTAVDAAEMGLCIIDAGHFGTEKFAAELLAKKIRERFGGIEIICNNKVEDPFKVY